MTATPITPFKAEFPVSDINGKRSWQPCEVVAVTNDVTGHGQFTVLVEDEDGMLWTHSAEFVRRKAAPPPAPADRFVVLS